MMINKIQLLLLFLFINTFCFAQWQPDFRLTNNPAVSKLCLNNTRSICVYSNYVHVVWEDYRDGDSAEVYYKRSTDNGLTWLNDIRLTNDPSRSENATIACFGNTLHVIWLDSRYGNYQIFYKRSTDNGVNWTPDVKLTNEIGVFFPSITVSGVNIHIVFSGFRTGNVNVSYLKSLNSGSTWQLDTNIIQSIGGESEPSISCYNNNIHLVWTDTRDGNNEVYYKKSIDNGSSWNQEIRLTNNSSQSYSPSIASFGNTVGIVWTDDRHEILNFEVYFIKSLNNGQDWDPEIRLTNSLNYSQFPVISIQNINIRIVWQDERNAISEIYFINSTNLGNSWLPETRLTFMQTANLFPNMDVQDTTIHVIWPDMRDGNSEIYYKKNLGGNSSTPSVILVQPPNLLGYTKDTIRWQSNDVINVKLELSTNNGNTWGPIITNIPASTGNYIWDSIPNVSSSQCKIKISSVENPNINSTSGIFSISALNYVANDSLIINRRKSVFRCQNIAGNTLYKFVFTFIPNTSSKVPTGFTSQYVVFSVNNYVVLDSILDNFVPAEYTWQAYNQNNSEIGTARKFMKVNVIPPINRNLMPILLIHGLNSDNSTWNAIKTLPLNSSLWNFEYPNNGDIRKSAWALSRVIKFVIDSTLMSISRVNILSHSMGGLVTRAYTVNMGRDLVGNIVSYNNDVNNVAFLAPPNNGGRFAFIASLINKMAIPILHTNLVCPAILQLDQYSDFIDSLKQVPLPNGIKYLVVAGYNSSFIQWLIDKLLYNPPTILESIINLIAGSINESLRNDVWVNVPSAINNASGTFDQYKLLFRNHANICTYDLNVLTGILGNFYPDGIIASDNYLNLRLNTIYGKVETTNGLKKVTTSPSGYVKLFRNGDQNPYISYLKTDGSYSFCNLPQGSYFIKTFLDGYRNDSLILFLDSTGTQVNQNILVISDPSFVGPINSKITINNNSLFTNSLNVTLNIESNNASSFIVSDKIDFEGAVWQSYTTNMNFTFSDTTRGTKTIFVKFRNATLVESVEYFDNIEYDQFSAAQLNVTSSPSGGMIFLNGVNSGITTPYSFTNIPFGDYNINVIKSGFTSSPNFDYVKVINNQTYNSTFAFVNIAPQQVRKFEYSYSFDTLKFNWQAPSDEDLMRVRVTYRTDGRFPANPDDGTSVYNENNLPDHFYNFNISSLIPNSNYNFSIFSIDSLSSISLGLDTLITFMPIGIINQNQIPTEYKLHNAYPNPFNPFTSIICDIKAKVDVRLVVYNILGREIVVLINQEMNPGSYKIDWDASNYPSGVYFYKLEAGDFVDSKKMILIK